MTRDNGKLEHVQDDVTEKKPEEANQELPEEHRQCEN